MFPEAIKNAHDAALLEQIFTLFYVFSSERKLKNLYG